jgi:hypothetical protein
MIEALIYSIIYSYQPEDNNKVFTIIDKVLGSTHPSDKVYSSTDCNFSLKYFSSTKTNSPINMLVQDGELNSNKILINYSDSTDDFQYNVYNVTDAVGVVENDKQSFDNIAIDDLLEQSTTELISGQKVK